MTHCLAPNCELGGIGCDNMTVVIVGILHGKSEEEWYEWVAQRATNNSRYYNPDAADKFGNNPPAGTPTPAVVQETANPVVADEQTNLDAGIEQTDVSVDEKPSAL
ncbi:Protein phosphatase 2C 2 [Basidiobolus ranarum]|uniref:Protein phosphatase 2C 2 n=1 Tax=Basidiobolus ranarum TaxID=34480 RepID=A0ABR2VVK4_9FUNG